MDHRELMPVVSTPDADNTGSAEMTTKPSHARVAQRLRHELVEYAAVTAYLWVCLGSLLLYKASLLQGAGLGVVPFGTALVKALVLGKFILIGHALKLGGSGARSPIVVRILVRAALFVLLLVLLSAVEEVVLDLIHERPIRGVAAAIAGGTLPELLAASLLMLLILIPYFAWREVKAELGEGKLRQLLFDVPPGSAELRANTIPHP
jgi:hypothetical protein